MKKIFLTLGVLLCFSIAAFATTAAVPKADAVAVTAQHVEVEVRQASGHTVSQPPGTAAHSRREFAPVIFENQATVAASQAGFT